jgi:hypothetical protein
MGRGLVTGLSLRRPWSDRRPAYLEYVADKVALRNFATPPPPMYFQCSVSIIHQ